MRLYSIAPSRRLGKIQSSGVHRDCSRPRGLRWAARSFASITASDSAKGYQSIGSFHSENLNEILQIPDNQYAPPSLPFKGVQHEPDLDDLDIFDSKTASEAFLLDLSSWTFLNHGAFGAALRVGYDRAAQWRRYLETQPLRYFDRSLLPHLAHSTRRLATFVDATPTNLALLPNVTSGLNAVFAGFHRHNRSLGQSSHVILFDTTYGSTKKMTQQYFGANNVSELSLLSTHSLHQLATSKDPTKVIEQILHEFVAQLDAAVLHDTNLLLVLDHTTSNTALTFPVQRLAKYTKQLVTEKFGQDDNKFPKLVVVVDGAHGLLAQDLKIEQDMVDVDFYLTNGHKWACTPRGVGLLYAKPCYHDTILAQPAIVSHGVDAPDLFSRFVWDGCRDYAAALAVPQVLDFWERSRPNDILEYLRSNLQQGIAVLAEAWHPDSMDKSNWAGNVTLVDAESPFLSPMALVRLPTRMQPSEGATSTHAKAVQDYLYQSAIEVPIKVVDDQLYVRVSCHIYNDTEDFVQLATAIQKSQGAL